MLETFKAHYRPEVGFMFELIQKLCMIQAPSGREFRLADKITEIIMPYVDDCRKDRLGNVIAFIRGEGENKQKILYAAHMDEVSGIVTRIEGNGSIRFTYNGGYNWTSGAYQKVCFFGGASGMLIPPSGGTAPNEYNSYIDIGAKSRDEALELVGIGETFTMVPGITRMAGTRIAGHPIDNRIGCAVLLEAAREIYERGVRPYNDIYFSFTVQEELALPSSGGSVVSFAVQPDIGIGVDVCASGDYNGAPTIDICLGGGAAIHIKDNSLIADYDLVNEMQEAAEENDIDYQLFAGYNGGNDAVPMQKVGLGCRAGLISIPMRYLHTAAETADLTDADACIDLVEALCDKPLKKVD